MWLSNSLLGLVSLGGSSKWFGLCQSVIRLTAILFLAFVTGCAVNQVKLTGEDYRKPSTPYIVSPVSSMPSPVTEPNYRMILIGDAGAPQDGEQTLSLLGEWGDVYKSKTSVVFLGDNLYWQGLREDDLIRGKAVLRQLLDSTDALKVFVPGNHDWSFDAETGAETLKRQEDFIKSYAESPSEFLPTMGCPGPVVKTMYQTPEGENVVLLALDTHWWLMTDTQWRPECNMPTTSHAASELNRLLEKYKDDFVVVAAHHPIQTSGPHGGFKRRWIVDFLSWLFEFQQDIGDPLYDTMIEEISGAFLSNPPELFAAGHDHSLQIMKGGMLADYLLVSGAGSKKKVSPVTHIQETLFAHGHEGFMVLDFYSGQLGEKESKTILRVVEPGSGVVAELELSR